MASQGPNSPGTTANTAYGSGRSNWNNVNNAKVSDNSYATATAMGVGSTYLDCTNFGFSIPSGATINGVQVDVERKSNLNVASAYVMDAVLYLLVSGSPTGANSADTSTHWPTSDTYKSYGGSANLMGATLTDSDVNGSGFGVRLSCNAYRTGKASPTASVDHVRITVTYTEAGSGGVPKHAMHYARMRNVA